MFQPDSNVDGEHMRAQAIDQFVDFGLTEYEARGFVALTRLSEATAKEISELSGVPNSRVYDALDSLHGKGFVEIERSSPRRYRAVRVDEVFTQLRERYDARITSLSDTLAALPRIDRDGETDDPGIWTIESREHVLAREDALIREAEEEVVFRLGTEEALTDSSVERLAVASDGGVPVTVEVPSDGLAGRLRDRLPDASVRVVGEPPGEPDDESIGRVLLVDREKVLLSTFSGSYLPDAPLESAVWTTGGGGPATGLVHTVRGLVASD